MKVSNCLVIHALFLRPAPEVGARQAIECINILRISGCRKQRGSSNVFWESTEVEQVHHQTRKAPDHHQSQRVQLQEEEAKAKGADRATGRIDQVAAARQLRVRHTCEAGLRL